MLQTLHVRNLALVEEVSVDFLPGLNVVTGETGAGKSVIIGALGLLLGDRADKSLIRAGADQCVAEAVFQLRDSGAVDAVLEEAGLPACEGGQLLVRRSLQSSGTGRILVNNGHATLQILKQVGQLLVDMHGPYDHQSLLSPEFQMDILDAFGHLRDIRGDYAALYQEWRDLREARRDLEGTDEQEVARQIEMLAYQIREIEEVAPVAGEEDSLEEEQRQVAHAQRIIELSAAIQTALSEGDASAFNGLADTQRALAELAALVKEAGEWQRQAHSIAVQIKDLAETVEHHVRHIEGDPARLQWLEERMAQYHRLTRKYGPGTEDVLAHLGRCKERQRELEGRGERLKELDGRIAGTRVKLDALGGRLGKARRQAASRLAKTITAELGSLGFPHGAFAVTLSVLGEPVASGLDAIEFVFAPNAGEPERPLRAIASSGEISRVMLAVKAVLADHDSIPVLVFDEIDANVGGAMGTAIGTKLGTVGLHHQVLCITHLPQVAVCGQAHFAVAKEVVQGRTRTRINLLDKEARVEEIARMLGGRDLTSVTLKHAREMLKGH